MNAWPGGRDPSLFTNPRNVSEKSQTTRPSGNTTDKAPSAPVQSSSSVLLLPYDSNIAWNALSGVTFTAGAGAWDRAFGLATSHASETRQPPGRNQCRANAFNNANRDEDFVFTQSFSASRQRTQALHFAVRGGERHFENSKSGF